MNYKRLLRAAALLGCCFGLEASAAPVGYTAWDVSGSDRLMKFDLSTGAGTTIGSGIGFNDVDGLALDATGVLWGVNDSTNQLLRIDTVSGVGTAIGSFGSGFNDMGLAFGSDGTLYMASTDGSSVGRMYTVNTATGAATLLGTFASGLRVRSLAFADGVLYGWSNIDTLLKIDTTTGAATTVGAFAFPSPVVGQDGMDADPSNGALWAIAEVENRTYRIDVTTGAATIVAASLTCDGGSCSAGGFNGLAIAGPVPEPHEWAMLMSGLALIGIARLQRKR